MTSNPASLPPPAWLRDDIIESNIPLNNDPIASNSMKSSSSSANNFLTIGLSSSSSSGSAAGEEKPPMEAKKFYLFWGMKIISVSLCILMAATAVLGLGDIQSVDESGKIYVAIYMFLFALLLFGFEIVGVREIEWLDHLYRRNFGFLYSTTGKALFVIFIAFLTFGLGAPELLSMCTGISWALYGSGIIALYLKYPELFD